MADVSWNNITPSLQTISGSDIIRNNTSGVGRAVSNQVQNDNGYIKCILNIDSGGGKQYPFGLTSHPNPSVYTQFPYLMRPQTDGETVFLFENNVVIGADKYVDSDNFDENTVWRIVIEDLAVMYQYSLDGGVSFQVMWTSKLPFDMSDWRFGALLNFRESELLDAGIE